jgi:signal transduction histidine kinase
MTGKGRIAEHPSRRFRQIVVIHVIWLAMVCLLGVWWSTLVLDQAETISRLEGTPDHWLKTRRMLIWETGTFLVLLLASAGALFWLFWRDFKRTRGLQAFFASVTHELRTPLTSIRLQAESIADAADSEQRKALVDRLLEDTNRLESQVNRTLELARVEGGGAVFLRQISLKPWLERQIRSWEETYNGRVDFKLDLESVVIDADPNALEVILKNLLENSVRHARKDKVEVTLSTRAASLLYRDNGDGFAGDPRLLGRIFEKGEASQGAGVGLYLIKILMQRMGGDVHFLAGPSQPGFGAELRFSAAKGEAHG